ncbi:DNA polymerase I, partial [Geodia barretti]
EALVDDHGRPRDGAPVLPRHSHAAPPDRFHNRGRRTGVYGFTNVFLRALQDWKPSHYAIAFDTPAPTFRHERFEEYKAQREPSPPELRPQFGRVKELMQAFGVPIFEVEGFEADDVIGTLCRLAEEQGLDSVILTGDRDTFQLISPHVRVDLSYSIQDRKTIFPGVPKVGEKRAIALLNDFYDLEGIYQHLDEVKPPSVKQSLAESRDRAFENRILMTISREAPVELSLDAARTGSYDRQRVVSLLTELEFHTVIPRLPVPIWDPGAGTAKVEPQVSAAETDYVTVQTGEALEAMLAGLRSAGSFSFDTETTSLDPMQADLVGLSFAVEPGKAWYVPVGHREGDQLPLEEVLARVKPLMEDPNLVKCAHNANFDLMVLASHGINTRNVDFDTMVAAHLLSRNQIGLKNLSLDLLGVEMQQITELIGKGARQKTFDHVAIEDATPYAAADADMTARLRLKLEPQIQQNKLSNLMNEIEVPLTPVLVQMQRQGIKVDVGMLHEMARDLNQQMHQTEMELYESIGHTTKRTKTGYSTDANSLENLKGLHPVVDNILDYRQTSKLKSTYVDTLPELINPATGRIHTSYNQVGSATGRMSSSDPNLQNIPIRTELGRQVRRAFIAEEAPDWTLFSADYSQIELRVLAHLSQDPELLEAFRRGEDIHAATASLMNDVPINEVTSDQRRIAKVLNFGVIYGLSAHGISQQTGFSREEGAHFIDTYFNKYPSIAGYLEEVKAKTRETQYVETLRGRRRYMPDVNASNFNVRHAAERMAINMPIQGTAADIMKVHDELVFEVPREEMNDLQALVFDEMPAAMDLDVTLKVEAKWGDTWGDME